MSKRINVCNEIYWRKPNKGRRTFTELKYLHLKDKYNKKTYLLLVKSTFLPIFKNFNDHPSLGQLMKRHVVAFRKYSQSISNASIAYI